MITNTATLTPAPPAQLDLIDLREFDGYGELRAREVKFAEAVFQGMTQRAAARAAGVRGSEEVCDQAGHELMRRPRVQRLLAQAWGRAGASIHSTLAQAAQLQKQAFAEIQQSTAASHRRDAFKMWRECSTLIASIHGKLTLNVTGQIDHAHTHVGFMLPPTALPVLAQMRREASEARNVTAA